MGQRVTATKCGCEDICPTGLEYDNGVCRCPDVTNYYDPVTLKCVMCPCGVLCNGTSSTSACPSGQYSPMGSSVCATCPEGTSVSSDRCGCVDICPPGLVYQDGVCLCPSLTQYYDTAIGQCLNCPCGMSCNGTSSVARCPSGTFAPSGAGICSNCSEGYAPSSD